MCSRAPGLGCLAVHRREGCLGIRPRWRRLQSIGRSMWATHVVRSMRGVIANSRYTASMFGQGSGRFNPLVVYPQLTLPDDATPDTEKVPEARQQIAFIGRIEEEKGILEALEILARLPATYRLTVVGEGTAREVAEQRTRELNLADRVTFLAWLGRDRLFQILNGTGVVIVPSLRGEGFGMVGVEALYSGTPVVAYEAGGVLEWCDGTFLRFVGPGDRAEAAAQIVALTSDPATWAEACRSAGEQARRRFDQPRQRALLLSALGLNDR